MTIAFSTEQPTVNSGTRATGPFRASPGDLPSWAYSELEQDFKEVTGDVRTAGAVLAGIATNLTDVAQHLALLEGWASRVETEELRHANGSLESVPVRDFDFSTTWARYSACCRR